MRGFRAWHKKLNRYLEPHEFYITPIGEVATACFTTLDGEVIIVNSIEDFSCDDFEEGLVILEEDTSLKDKNGKEICEGDIVKCGPYCGRPIVFEEGRYWLGEEPDDLFTSSVHWDIEIIGNIHENPELLEGKK